MLRDSIIVYYRNDGTLTHLHVYKTRGKVLCPQVEGILSRFEKVVQSSMFMRILKPQGLRQLDLHYTSEMAKVE